MPKSETPEILSPKVYMVLISLATWAYNLPCAGHVCTGTHTPGSQYGVAAPSITEVIQHLLFWVFEIFRFSGHMWMSGCSAPFPIWCAYPWWHRGWRGVPHLTGWTHPNHACILGKKDETQNRGILQWHMLAYAGICDCNRPVIEHLIQLSLYPRQHPRPGGHGHRGDMCAPPTTTVVVWQWDTIACCKELDNGKARHWHMLAYASRESPALAYAGIC